MKNNFLDEINEKIKTQEDIPWIHAYLSLTKQIKIIRKSLGMTQKQLAKKVGSSQESIARLEAGLVEPNIKTLKKISEALEADLQILVVPKQKILKILEEKAEQKAKEIISFSANSSALEQQNPSKQILKRQLLSLKAEIIEKKRSSLWD